MTAKTNAWLVMVASAIAGCDFSVDDGWDDGEQWHPEPPPAHPYTPGPSPSPTPYPSSDAAVPLGPSATPRALTPAIAWRSGDAAVHAQQVSFLGTFPEAFSLQTSALRPPDAALTVVSDQPSGGRFAYGDIVAVRPGAAATSCASGLCPTLPCANATPTCGGAQCTSKTCQRVCDGSSCRTQCGSPAPAAACNTGGAPPTIEGVVAGYLVFYNDREIAAGTLLAGVFNDYRSLAPGLHLIRTDALTPDQQQQASLCRCSAAERALERYNVLEQSSYADEAELRSELGLRATLGETVASERALAYDHMVQAAHVEQRCRFQLLAVATDTPDGCALRVSLGAPLPPPLLPL